LVREALGISEKEAAAIFRRTVRTYRRIEAGHALPGAFEFVTFIEQYRVPFGWLVYGDVPQDCAGLAPAAAIRKMTGMVTH
jgi:hypothetical protein